MDKTNHTDDGGKKVYEKYFCPCGYIYDEETGDLDNGLEPGTKWEDVPEDWLCPVCYLGKEDFVKIED